MSKNTAAAYTGWQNQDPNKQDKNKNEERDRVPLEDLVHAGVVGLIDAFNKFDHSKHVQFGSYAKFRIRGAILDSLREMDWGPRELRRKARKVEEAHRKLSLVLSRAPTENEMAAEL